MNKLSIFSFLTTLFLVVCTQGREIVKDSAGNSVEVGQWYFIQPVKTASNNGGGLIPAPAIVRYCPLAITQAPHPDQPGVPVRFIHLYTLQDNFVRTTISYMIEFKSTRPVCVSNLWVANATELSDVSKEPLIILSGIERTRNASFFVEKAEGANTYKLSNTFGNIGTKPGGSWLGERQLVLTNDNAKRLLFIFKKVADVTTATTSTSLVEKLGLRMFAF